MKLCIVTPSVLKGDGQGRANYEIVKEAIRRNYHITLLARNVDPDLQKHSHITWIDFLVERLPTSLLKELVFSRLSTQWLARHHQEFDLIQVYGAVTDAKGNINTAQFVHSAWLNSSVHISRVRRDFYGIYQWLYTALNAYWEKKSFHQAKVVIAVSERVKQELIDIGIPEESIRVIYNGVDVDEFFPGVAERSQFGLPEGVTIALFAGDIRLNRKNLDTVLYALVQVPELHLAVVGTLERSPYPQLAAKLGLTNRVHFLGYRRDLADIMRTTDLFVFPSRYEPFGMVVLEAMASGLPVITAKTTGAAEVVSSDCGFIVSDPDDLEALANFLHKIADDPEQRQKMGQGGRIIAQQHTWSSKVKSYLDLFEEAI